MTEVSEPEKEGRPLDSPISVRSIPMVKPPMPPTHALRVMNEDQPGISPTLDSEDRYSISESPPNIQLGPTPDVESLSERPSTTLSADTHRQATDPFADFDGVHITPPRQLSSTIATTHSRQVSLTQPPLVDGPQSRAGSPGESMVYYPAPVPMMINLPQRLSKLPMAQRDKRRSEMLVALPNDVRKSAAWLPDVLDGPKADVDAHLASTPSNRIDKRQSMADLPPQLRASMFFDHPSIPQDIELKGQSAVATLDSILDASAFAPVSAFTDHPIAGHLGANVYNRSSPGQNVVGSGHDQVIHRQSRSSLHLLTKRYSSNTLLQNTKLRRTSFLSPEKEIGQREMMASQFEHDLPFDDTEATQTEAERASFLHSQRDRAYDGSEHGSRDEQENLDPQDGPLAEGRLNEDGGFRDEDPYNGPPTTLLAELQLRKHQQKQRNRTAATDYPQGMHSTLLQLDAVAQVEKQSRKQKHIKLAWEDPNARHPGVENEDDEDVPLGMLFSGRKIQARNAAESYDEDRPLGLIARRAMEDNEPLSQRRARLRGEPLVRVPNVDKRVNANAIEVPGMTTTTIEVDASREGETLGQRLKRLQATNITTKTPSIIGEFASEVMSQFGGPATADEATGLKAQDFDVEEETLGQRRKRLQAEKQGKSHDVSGQSIDATVPQLKKRHSMADILQAHPVSEKRVMSQERYSSFNGGLAGPGAVGGLLQQNQQLQAQSCQQLGGRPGLLRSAQSTLTAPRPTYMDHRASSGSVLMASGLGIPGLSAYQPGFSGIYAPNSGVSSPYGSAMPYANPIEIHNSSLGLNGYAGMAPNGSTMVLPVGSDTPVDTRHRDMVDRWRQSVRY